MNIIVCIFLSVWLVVALLGLCRPRKLMERFPSITELFGFHPDKLTRGGLIFYRLMHGVLLLFCLFVLGLMSAGRVQF